MEKILKEYISDYKFEVAKHKLTSIQEKGGVILYVQYNDLSMQEVVDLKVNLDEFDVELLTVNKQLQTNFKNGWFVEMNNVPNNLFFFLIKNKGKLLKMKGCLTKNSKAKLLYAYEPKTGEIISLKKIDERLFHEIPLNTQLDFGGLSLIMTLKNICDLGYSMEKLP